MKTNQKVVGWMSILIILTIIAIPIYINVAHANVDKQLRVKGFLFDKLETASDEAALRRLSASRTPPKVKSDEEVKVERRTIETRKGKKVPLLIYRSAHKNAQQETDIPGMLWLHGGGYAMGSPEAEFDNAKEFIATANSVIVAPDYTLSVDEPYPAALQDAYETLFWMKEHAEELGFSNRQLFVGGGSAGGGLAAATTLYARDRDEVNVAYQFPLYPMLNDKMDTPSATNNEEFIWDTERSTIAWKLYLGDLYGTDDVPKYAAPSREEDYTGLPPTFTYIGELDPFYDETVEYVKNLEEAGVEVEFHAYKGAYHAFAGVSPKAKASQDAQKKLLNAYKKAAHDYFAEQE